MSNEESKGKKKREEKEGGKISTVLVVILIVLIWLAIFAALIKFDVGGFGSGVLYPVLKDVPVINAILPDMDDDNVAAGDEKYTSLAQAIERIEQLEGMLASNNSNSQANADYIAKLEQELANLQVYKDNQDAFEKRVLEFDENVVFADEAPDIEQYIQYYEQIQPDNAAKIYAECVEKYQYNARIKTQADTYGKMEPSQAAAILQEMTDGDLDLVAGILSSMGASKSSAILAQMDVETAAQITKKMTYSK